MTVARRARPVLGPNVDGIYPRCVWCGREVYALAVLAYSAGEARCGWRDCRGWLPADYRLTEGPEARGVSGAEVRAL